VKDWLDMNDTELEGVARAIGAYRPYVRDMVRERIAFARALIEVTGCRTVAEAVEQVKVWKGKADGHPRITGN
jgi:hypothetical protein